MLLMKFFNHAYHGTTLRYLSITQDDINSVYVKPLKYDERIKALLLVVIIALIVYVLIGYVVKWEGLATLDK